MMSKIIKKINYKFENTLSKGTTAIILWLSFITLLIAVLFALLYFVVSSDIDFFEAFKWSFLRTIDTGAINGGDNEKMEVLVWIISLIITLIGVFIFSALIGVLTTGLDRVLTKLRKGKSIVLEKDFTLILGWSNTVIKIISELILANANHKNKKIVILADKDKIEMEDEIEQKINQKDLLDNLNLSIKKKTKLYKTKIICRTGQPLDLDDLNIVQPDKAQSIIIIPPDTDSPDSFVVKAIIALNNLNIKADIITELHNEENNDTVSSMFDTDKNKNIRFIPTFDWLSKITAQTSQQSGYSQVLSELLSFMGNEIYVLKDIKNIVNKTFKSILFNPSQDNIAIGIIKNNNIIINPPLTEEGTDKEIKIDEGDKLITIQEDDPIDKSDKSGLLKFFNKIFPKKLFPDRRMDSIEHVEDKEFLTKNEIEKYVEISRISQHLNSKILILGINKRLKHIIKELSGYLRDNLQITLIAELKNAENMINDIKNDLKPPVSVSFENGDITNSKLLEEKNPALYDSIIILGYDDLAIQERDAKTIFTLLHINKILKDLKKNIVAEIYDEKNRRIIQEGNYCDFIISDNIVSSLISQTSQAHEIFEIYKDLFNEEGNEIYLRPVKFLRNDLKITFLDIIKICASHNEIAIGYTYKKSDHKNSPIDIKLNPNKKDILDLEKIQKIVVIASS